MDIPPPPRPRFDLIVIEYRVYLYYISSSLGLFKIKYRVRKGFVSFISVRILMREVELIYPRFELFQ